MPALPDYTVRPATAHDAPVVGRLAALDSAEPLALPALLAERDGCPVAALELATGRTVADPFQPAADAVALLELRRVQMQRAARPRGRGTWRALVPVLRGTV